MARGITGIRSEFTIMGGIEFDTNFKIKDIPTKMARQLKILTDQALQDTVVEIQLRTMSGRDINGNKFRGYSKEYKEFRAAIGRTTNVVTLQVQPIRAFGKRKRPPVTPPMLASIQSETKLAGRAAKVIGRIFFSSAGAAAKAKANKAQGRDFFGVSEEQKKKFREFIRNKLDVG